METDLSVAYSVYFVEEDWVSIYCCKRLTVSSAKEYDKASYMV